MEDKCIFLAECSLYMLLQNETAIFSLMDAMNANEIEQKFLAMLTKAVENYKVFMGMAFDDPFNIEMLTNFSDFFAKCVDIKKSEAVRTAVDGGSNIDQVSTEAIDVQIQQMFDENVQMQQAVDESVPYKSAKIYRKK